MCLFFYELIILQIVLRHHQDYDPIFELTYVKWATMVIDWTCKTTHVGALGDYANYAAKDGTPVAGGMRFQSDKTAYAQWVPYIAVSDVDATVTLARSLGGHVVMPATSLEHVGHSALLEDPTGAMFGILLPHGNISGS